MTWSNCGTEEWLSTTQVIPSLTSSSSKFNHRNFIELNEIVYTLMSCNYVGMNDGMASLLIPFSSIEEFISLVESAEKMKTEKETKQTKNKITLKIVDMS